MTTSWKDTMGADWYEGYDSDNTSNFVAIKSMPAGPAKDKAIALAQEEIIGLLEQKGVTRDQITGAKNPGSHVHGMYEDAMKAIKASDSNVDTRNVFQDVAYSKTSATDRGNKWGSDTDDSMGRSYLSSITADSTATIDDLYSSGFGRDADAAGKEYWEKELASGRHTIQSIATEFGRSEEANIRSTYSDEYGRDIGDEGLNYWMEHTGVQSGENAYTSDWNKADATADSNQVNISDAAHKFDASKLVADSIKSREYGATQYESSIRDHGWNVMGQASSQAQRDTKPPDAPFTDMETEQVLDWINQIRSGATTLQDVTNQLTDRSDRMSAFNEGDTDDYTTKDINGDGIISEDERQTGTPTGMGRFASLQEIQETIDSGETPDEIRERLGMQRWGLLTHENEKKLEDFKRKSADYDKYRNTFTGNLPTTGGIYDTRPPETGTGTGTGWTPEVPDKPGRPDPFPVDEKEINYMPNDGPDEFSSTPYGAAKKEFDAEAGILRPQVMPQPKAQDVGQRFTGTSAKGVKMKRSKASMGTIRGTKQLGREQQTKSLNI